MQTGYLFPFKKESDQVKTDTQRTILDVSGKVSNKTIIAWYRFHMN